jgi:uncharacterized protein (TIGR03435 family)
VHAHGRVEALSADSRGGDGAVEALVLNGQTTDGIATWLSGLLDRHVLNQTGVDGKFVIYLEYAPDDHAPALSIRAVDQPRGDSATAASDPAGPTIFAALEKLGLKIEPAKGPKGYIVIDRAERPSVDGR